MKIIEIKTLVGMDWVKTKIPLAKLIDDDEYRTENQNGWKVVARIREAK